MLQQHRFFLRPGYTSEKLLVEIIVNESADIEISKDLFGAIKELNPVIEDLQDLWMNDEVIVTVSCDKGEFLYSKDIWGLAFVMAEQNQECVLAIHEILARSEKFVKEEVDFSLYRSSKDE